MNLIEEFGSYENAKKHQIERALNGLLHEYDFELVDALLEYRREHGIYEIGDPVIRLDGSTPSVYRVHEIYECGGIGIVRHPTPTRPHWTCLPIDKLRHATDLEIKAGHRLP